MTKQEAIDTLQLNRPFAYSELQNAVDMAIKALEAQFKLKKYIERINQPEYYHIGWKRDEVLLMLQELLVGGTKDDKR